MSKFALLILFILLACGVRQPLDITLEFDAGHLRVESNPPGALIFLNGENQNKITPDTLNNIPVGQHYISVIKDGYKSTQDSFPVTILKDSLRRIDIPLESLVQTGYLIAVTEPSGALLFVDDQPSGKMTPDTLILAPGTRVVSARKNGFKNIEWNVNIVHEETQVHSATLEIEQRVLLEAFGNVSCVPCVASAENLETFRHAYPENTFALLEYFANWPAANDPFYLESTQDVDQRVQQVYQIFSLPSLKMNGTQSVDATDYDVLTTEFERIGSLQQTPLAISISRQKPSDSLYVEIDLFDYNNLLANSDLRLFVAVVENEIHYSNPPGTNGLKDFDFVFRQFLSSREGDSITDTNLSYVFEWPAWDYRHAQVIAFLQDIETRQIIQSSIN